MVVVTLVLGIILYFDASNKAGYRQFLEMQSGKADALAEFLAASQSPPEPPACWCVVQRNLSATLYDNCSAATCFNACTHVESATRLTTSCVSSGCGCNETPCALEVRTC